METMKLYYDVVETRGGSYDPSDALDVTYRVENDGVHLVEARDGAVVLYATETGPANPSHLSDAQEWLTRNGAAVTAVILVVIAVAVIGTGITRL